MKKLLFALEILGLAAVTYVLVGSMSGCRCGGGGSEYGKLVYQQRMLAKYRDKMVTARDRVVISTSTKCESKERGYISGTVLAGGAPLAGVNVTAWDTSYWFGYGSFTNTEGYYIITNLPDAPTSLWKVTTDNDSGYVDMWYDNKLSFWSADTVRVNAGDTTENIDFNLPKAGYISGTVTDETKGGLEGFWVDAYDANWNFVAWDITDSTGAYTIPGLAGNPAKGYAYKLNAWFWDTPYIGEWWDDKPEFYSADTVTVTEGDTTKPIDFELTLGGMITGTVTGPGKDSLEGIVIEAISIVNGGFVRTDGGGTDSLGQYTIAGLPLASGFVAGYRVRTAASGNYAQQWYNGKPNVKTADFVDITTPGQTVAGIDFQLAYGGILTGFVTSESKDSLPGINIYAYDSDAGHPLEPAAFTATAWGKELGKYEMALAPGDYRIRTDNTGGFIDEYYNNQTSWNDADLISISVKGTTYVDFSLAIGGKVEGTVYEIVTKQDTVPMPRAAIAAVRANTGEVVTFINSGVDGAYSLGGLPTGWYKVCAVPWADVVYPEITDLIHAFGFYDDKQTLETADSIYVTAPDSVVEGIDFILGAYAGGAISGTVYDQPKSPIEGAQVTAFGYAGLFYGWMPAQVGSTDANGDYVFMMPASGDYKVRASADGYPTVWYNQQDSLSADLVNVAAPDTTENIDFYLLGVAEDEQEFIYRLYQNQPNPFVGKTRIEYSVANRSHTSLKIYDVSGRLAITLADNTLEPGRYTAYWKGQDAKGKKLAAGIYFYRITSGNFKATRKLILLD